MRRCVVMSVLSNVGRQLRVDKAAEQHQPNSQRSNDEPLHDERHSLLSKRGGLHRLLLLNFPNYIVDHLFGQ